MVTVFPHEGASNNGHFRSFTEENSTTAKEFWNLSRRIIHNFPGNGVSGRIAKDSEFENSYDEREKILGIGFSP